MGALQTHTHIIPCDYVGCALVAPCCGWSEDRCLICSAARRDYRTALSEVAALCKCAPWVVRSVQVCLNFVANNLSQVICTDDYKRLTESCQGMVNEILAAVAVQGNQTVARGAARGAGAGGGGMGAGGVGGGGAGAGSAAHGGNAGQVATVAGRLRARRRDDELRALE